jgi:hypothetical protein
VIPLSSFAYNANLHHYNLDRESLEFMAREIVILRQGLTLLPMSAQVELLSTA